MKPTLSFIGISAAVLLLTFSASAQTSIKTGMDVANMTCGDLKALSQSQQETVSYKAMKIASMSDEEIAQMKKTVEEEGAKAQIDETPYILERSKGENASDSLTNDRPVSALLDACGDDDPMLVVDAAKAAAER